MATSIKKILKQAKEYDYLDSFQIKKYGFDIELVKKGVESTTNLVNHFHFLVNVKRTAIDTVDQFEEVTNVIYSIQEKRKDIGLVLKSLDKSKLQTHEAKKMFEDLKTFYFKKYEHLEILTESLVDELMDFNNDVNELLQPVWQLFQKLPDFIEQIKKIEDANGIVQYNPKYFLKWTSSKEHLEYLFNVWFECHLIEKVADTNTYIANFVDAKRNRFVDNDRQKIKLDLDTTKTELFYFIQKLCVKKLLENRYIDKSLEYIFITNDGVCCKGYGVQSSQGITAKKENVLEPFVKKVSDFKLK